MGATLERRAVIAARAVALAAAGLSLAGDLGAQTKTPAVPDAQVESNVLKALAGNSKLSDQHISSAAVYGVVTLSGQVKDEGTRSLAEDVVSRTAGVQKVVDELTLGDQGGSAVAQAAPPADGGSNSQLQSDGSYAPANPAPGGQVGQPPLSSQPPVNEAQLPPTAETQGGAADAQNGPAGPPPPPDSGYGATQPPYAQGGQPGYGQPTPTQSPYGQPTQPGPIPQRRS